MATFSPSPAPRRSARNRLAPNSPPRRIRVTGNSRNTSRLATPVRQPERNFTNDNGSVSMDVDEGGSTIADRLSSRPSGDTEFAKSDQLSVSFYATLPVELKQVLKSSGMSRSQQLCDASLLC